MLNILIYTIIDEENANVLEKVNSNNNAHNK